MLDGIGNINSYVKMQSLWGRFNQKRAEGFTAVKAYGSNAGAGVSDMATKTTLPSAAAGPSKTLGDPELLRIVGKLNGGQELSGMELEYLYKNSKNLYGKAKRVEHDREQFRQRLKSCKNPKEVEALRATVTAAVTAVASGSAATGEGSGAEQLAQGLSTMLYRALDNEFQRALRRDTLTKTARDEEE